MRRRSLANVQRNHRGTRRTNRRDTMNETTAQSLRQPLVLLAAAALFAGCADEPLAPDRAVIPHLKAVSAAEADPIGTLKRATARYHNLDAAKDDGYVFLHGCENRPDEGPVGTVYVHIGNLLDGVVDPALPDALIYHQAKPNQKPKLLGVEFAVPYGLWTEPQPPEFMGNSFQPEDEFGVWGLHVWIWTKNPEGMFAESNPNVSCIEE
jgi:hypothetical protein